MRLLLIGLVTLGGCALPMGDGPASDEEWRDTDVSRLFAAHEAHINPGSLDFSFFVHADGPHVILATVPGRDDLSVGEVAWARQPSGDQLVVRRDIDIHTVPVETLMRQGEVFVARDENGESCVGYLGELSVMRLISRDMLADSVATTVSEAEYEFLYSRDAIDGIVEPVLAWENAMRTYLVARWETDDDCIPAAWGHASEHAPITYAEVSAESYAVEAHAQFRAHANWEIQQDYFDEVRQDPYELETREEVWPAGLWDEGYFTARAFEAEDGRHVVIASADLSNGCIYGPDLHFLYDVAADGSLVVRRTIESLPFGEWSLIERDSVLLFISRDTLRSVGDSDEYDTIATAEYGCPC
jgi:hypothetical protein